MYFYKNKVLADFDATTLFKKYLPNYFELLYLIIKFE